VMKNPKVTLLVMGGTRYEIHSTPLCHLQVVLVTWELSARPSSSLSGLWLGTVSALWSGG
jgi:hypothetical protein